MEHELPPEQPVMVVTDGPDAVGVLIWHSDWDGTPASLYAKALEQEHTGFPLVSNPAFKPATWGVAQSVMSTYALGLPVYDINEDADPVAPADVAKDTKAAKKSVKKKSKLDAQKADLLAPRGEVPGDDGETYTITKLDMVSSQWRQAAVQILRILDPEGYAHYRKLKYEKGQKPDLKTRKKAYSYAIRRFLDISYKIPGC